MQKFLIRSVLLIMCFGVMSGCVLALGAVGGAGGVVYYKGNLKQYLNYPVTDIYEATMQTMADEGFRIFNDEHDPYKAQMKFEDTEGKSIWVDIEASTRETSEIKIRVGVKGDKARASQLLEKIKGRLLL
ncbi:MAG: DUF3568 family protein [Candidatus Hydrogenedentota bacterium]